MKLIINRKSLAQAHAASLETKLAVDLRLMMSFIC